MVIKIERVLEKTDTDSIDLAQTSKQCLFHQAIKYCLTISCPYNHTYTCMSALKYNENDYALEQVKNHLKVVWSPKNGILNLNKFYQEILMLDHSYLSTVSKKKK